MSKQVMPANCDKVAREYEHAPHLWKIEGMESWVYKCEGYGQPEDAV